MTFREFVLKVLGWCPKVSLESSLEKPEKVSISKKRLSLFVGIFLIVIVGSYGLWNFYVYSSELKKRGMPITVKIKNNEYTYYDNDLPQDLNYIELMHYTLHFSLNFEDSWYANGSSMESTSLQFNDTQSIKTCLDTINMMPNVVRNAVKTLICMNVTEIYPLFLSTGPGWGDLKFIFFWGTIDSGDGGNTEFWLLFNEDEYSYVLDLRCVWPQMHYTVYDIYFTIPHEGNNYKVNINKMPRYQISV